MEKVAIDDLELTANPPAAVQRNLTRPLGTEDVALNYYELEPGDAFAYAYHNHGIQEEVFYVIEGTATFETEAGDVAVGPGELIRFPPGEYQRGTNRATSGWSRWRSARRSSTARWTRPATAPTAASSRARRSTWTARTTSRRARSAARRPGGGPRPAEPGYMYMRSSGNSRPVRGASAWASASIRSASSAWYRLSRSASASSSAWSTSNA